MKNKGLGTCPVGRTCAGGPAPGPVGRTCAGGPGGPGGPDLRRRAGLAPAGLHPARDGPTLPPGSNILHHSPLLDPRGNNHRGNTGT